LRRRYCGMPSAPVEVVRRAVALYAEAARGHDDEDARARSFEEFGTFFDPAAEWHEDPEWPGTDTYRGAGEIQRYVEGQFEDVWKEVRIDVDELVELGGGRV